jgi:RimJ/RimL family protein N-acetyltransferase
MRTMQLRDISMEDLPLYEALLTDPRIMAELGGPLPRDGLDRKLQGIVDEVGAGKTWFFVIVEDGASAGTVCVWDHEWEGQTINEIGWMVATDFQGRGLATEAVRSVLDRARTERRWDVIHAFPVVSNGPSNAICRKTGFSRIQELDIDYAGRTLRCNHWRVDVRFAVPSESA